MAAELSTAFTSPLPAGMSPISHAAPVWARPSDYDFFLIVPREAVLVLGGHQPATADTGDLTCLMQPEVI